MRARQGAQFLPTLVVVHANGAAVCLSRLRAILACLCRRPLTLVGRSGRRKGGQSVRSERRKAGNVCERGAARHWRTDDEDGEQSDSHLPYAVGSLGSHLNGVGLPLGQVDQSGRRRSGIAHCGG